MDKLQGKTRSLSHIKKTHNSIYFRKTIVSTERELTILSFLVIMFSVFSVLSIIYDIVVSVLAERYYNERSDKWNDGKLLVYA